MRPPSDGPEPPAAGRGGRVLADTRPGRRLGVLCAHLGKSRRPLHGRSVEGSTFPWPACRLWALLCLAVTHQCQRRPSGLVCCLCLKAVDGPSLHPGPGGSRTSRRALAPAHVPPEGPCPPFPRPLGETRPQRVTLQDMRRSHRSPSQEKGRGRLVSGEPAGRIFSVGAN